MRDGPEMGGAPQTRGFHDFGSPTQIIEVAIGTGLSMSGDDERSAFLGRFVHTYYLIRVKGPAELEVKNVSCESRYLRFQRTAPSRVSSSTMPASANCWRMRSEAAKSRRLRAAWRAATSVSISASLRPAALST